MIFFDFDKPKVSGQESGIFLNAFKEGKGK